MAGINSETGGFLLIIFYGFHCFTVEWANPQLPSWPTNIRKFSEKQVFDIWAFTGNSHKQKDSLDIENGLAFSPKLGSK